MANTVYLWGVGFTFWITEEYISKDATGNTTLKHSVYVKVNSATVDSNGYISPSGIYTYLEGRLSFYRYAVDGSCVYSDPGYRSVMLGVQTLSSWRVGETYTLYTTTGNWSTDVDCYQKIKASLSFVYSAGGPVFNIGTPVSLITSRYSYPICQISVSKSSAKVNENVVVYTNRTKNVKTSVLFCYGSASASSYWASYQNQDTSVTIKSSDIYNTIHQHFVSPTLACCVRVYTYTVGGTLIGYTEKTITYSVIIPQIACRTPNFNIGDPITFDTGNGTPLKVKLVIGATTIASELEGASWTWQGTSWFYAQMPTTTKQSFIVAQVFLNSQGGSLGTTYTTITASVDVPSNKPSFATATYFDNRTTTVNLTGNNQVIIQGQSEVKIQLTGLVAKNSATLSKVVVTYAGKTFTGTSPAKTCYMIIPSASVTDNLPVRVDVYDSRGLTSTKTFSFATWKAYSPPAITLATAVRNNNGIGVDLSLALKGSVSAYIAEKKMFGYKYRYKEYGASSYGADVILLSGGSSSVPTINYSGVTNSGTFSIAKKYQVEITLYDYFGSTVRTIVIATASPEISIREKSVGIGCIPDQAYVLDVKGVARFQDGAKIGTGTKLVCSGIYLDLVTLQNRWTAYSATYGSPPIVYLDAGVVTFTGLIKGGTISGATVCIGTIPAFYAPSKTHIFAVATSGGVAQVSVWTDGTINLYSTGYTGNPVVWISLAGMTYHKTI